MCPCISPFCQKERKGLGLERYLVANQAMLGTNLGRSKWCRSSPRRARRREGIFQLASLGLRVESLCTVVLSESKIYLAMLPNQDRRFSILLPGDPARDCGWLFTPPTLLAFFKLPALLFSNDTFGTSKYCGGGVPSSPDSFSDLRFKFDEDALRGLCVDDREVVVAGFVKSDSPPRM